MGGHRTPGQRAGPTRARVLAAAHQLLADSGLEALTMRPSPSAGLHDVMASTYRVLLAHPDLVPLYLARQGARGPNAQRLGDIMFRLLDGAVLSGPRAREARRVLIVYTIGFAAFTTRPPIDADADPLLRGEEMSRNFDSGLRWLLEGIVAPTPELSSQ